MMETRYCEGHKENLPLIEFRQGLDKRDGKYYYHTTLCLKCYRKSYREKNREKILEYQKKHYLENREAIREKQRRRHKKTYKHRKRKTTEEKERAKFLKLTLDNNIEINFN